MTRTRAARTAGTWWVIDDHPRRVSVLTRTVTLVCSVTEDPAEAVLLGLVDRDPRVIINLVFDEPSEISGATGRQVDEVLLEAQHRGLLKGDRGEGDGSVAWWSRVSLTVIGLRSLGLWPPFERELESGLWDAGYWGARARPLLAELHDNPPAHGYYFREGLGEADPEPAQRWACVLLLIEAGLLLGEVQTEGVANPARHRARRSSASSDAGRPVGAGGGTAAWRRASGCHCDRCRRGSGRTVAGDRGRPRRRHHVSRRRSAAVVAAE
jgi:hypothetical protein